jgi:zinc transport system substrate-binding protein
MTRQSSRAIAAPRVRMAAMLFARLTALVLAIAALATAAEARPPHVVASVAPLHSLVAGVMAGVGEPHLLIAAAASPHDYALRPSDARALEKAEVVFWVGPALEGFLARPLAALAARARLVTLGDSAAIMRLPARRNTPPDASLDAATIDPHIWLGVANARAIVDIVVARLAAHDGANAPAYRANGAQLAARLDDLAGEIRAIIAPVATQPYVVFHDAYRYFEHDFAIAPVAAVTPSPELRPGARGLARLRRTIADTGARCIFAEPQTTTSLVATIAADVGARGSELDPLGRDLTPGPGLYFALMHTLAKALTTCLTGPG